MKFLRSKLVFAFIFLMSAACLLSMLIAVRTTITMIEKKEQAIKPTVTQNKDMSNTKYLTAGKTTGIPLYFNGVKVDGFGAFIADKNQFLYPIDAILKKIGIKYSYYDSDDILQAAINGKKIILNLGKDKVSINGKDIDISAAPLASNNHILVSRDMLAKLDGFDPDGFIDKKTAFINYFPEYLDNADEKVDLLRFVNGIANISDIEDTNPVFVPKDNTGQKGVLVSSENGKAVLLKSGEKVYIIGGSGGETSIRNINVDSSATLSDDGQYAYWIDQNKKTSYLYEIKTGKTTELGDYYFQIQSDLNDNDSVLLGTVISDYKVGKNYKRITFTDENHSAFYTFIEKNGKPFISGASVYSPDGKKLLCCMTGKCYLLNIDGTQKTLLGDNEGKEFSWVTNTKIFMLDHQANNMFLITQKGKTSIEVNEKWNKVGAALNGDVFYTRGNTLYSESDGVEKEIGNMPWTCQYVYGLSAADPIIAVSDQEEDGVFYINGGKIDKIGKVSLLLNSPIKGNIATRFGVGISSSPDGKSEALFQVEDGYITCDCLNLKSGLQKKIVLDSRIKDQTDIDDVKAQWITSDRLLVFNGQKGWIIDFKNDVKIFGWTEAAGSLIKDVLMMN